jgi:Tol biopolymer transport system component
MGLLELQKKRRQIIMKKIFALTLTLLLLVSYSCSKNSTSPANVDNPVEDNYVFDRWASSENFEITINSTDGESIKLTRNYQDYKPTWSIDGTKLTFFRMLEYEQGFGISKTKIGVINTNGSGLRLLTVGDYPDFNPTWTRDGTNMILFTRYDREPYLRMKIYMISPDGSPGDEILLSDPSFQYSEWASSGLKDGRIFIDRWGSGFKSFLLTPSPGEKGRYEEVKRPTSLYWHKLSVSPNETKVAYMRYGPNDRAFEDAVICYADFDVNSRVISTEVMVTKANPNCIFEYPRWSKDEEYLIYDCNITGKFQIYAYRLSDGNVQIISLNSNIDSMYGNFDSLPK